MLEVCPLSELPPGEALRVDADPPIAVFHTEDGEVFAIDDTCSHQDASLADGWLEGCEVECPLHASRFDLRTGAVDAPPAKLPVRTHAVVVEDGMIRVELSTETPNLPPDIRARLGPGTAREARRHRRGLAGRPVRRARAARRRASSGRLTVVGDETRRPYDRPPLSKEFLAGDIDRGRLALEADDDDLEADWLLGTAATGSTPLRCTVELADGSRVIRADGVVIATGSRARRWPGCECAGRRARHPHDRRRPRPARRPAAPAPALVVIGAGFIGAEVASTARKLGLDVTVVEAAPTPLAGPARRATRRGRRRRAHGQRDHADLRCRRRRPDR